MLIILISHLIQLYNLRHEYELLRICGLIYHDEGGSSFCRNVVRLLLDQRFSNCGQRTTSGPRVLPL